MELNLQEALLVSIRMLMVPLGERTATAVNRAEPCDSR